MKPEDIKNSCRTLLQARKEGKLSQEILDYELSKIALETINDYKPKRLPTRPINDKDKPKMEKWEWSCEKVMMENLSNRRWLKIMHESLTKHNNPGSVRVSEILREYGEEV